MDIFKGIEVRILQERRSGEVYVNRNDLINALRKQAIKRQDEKMMSATLSAIADALEEGKVVK